MVPLKMQSYTCVPRMGVGTQGKYGFLRLGFERDGERTILREWERRAPLIVQQALYFDECWAELPCVYILSSGGPNLDGDRYEQHFRVGCDAFAHISTGAATKIAQMRYNYSSLLQRITLDERAYLEYLPEPIIPCRNSRYYTSTHISIAPSATLIYAETLLCGRRWSGERFDYDILSMGVRVERTSGELLFADRLIAEPERDAPSMRGLWGEWEIMASVLILTPNDIRDRIYASLSPLCDDSIAVGYSLLPNDCGIACKVLGDDSGLVKRIVREIASRVRAQVKGRRLAEDFPWR